MKHNQFAYKLINGKVTNKFCRIENKITYSYLDKNGNKKVDYNERKIRIQNERKNIEQNIINDLYLLDLNRDNHLNFFQKTFPYNTYL